MGRKAFQDSKQAVLDYLASLIVVAPESLSGQAGRAAAILGLTWDRVDFAQDKINLEHPEIQVPHKGRAIVPMTRTLKVRLLEAQRGAFSPCVIE
jgi:hypothetical protein